MEDWQDSPLVDAALLEVREHDIPWGLFDVGKISELVRTSGALSAREATLTAAMLLVMLKARPEVTAVDSSAHVTMTAQVFAFIERNSTTYRWPRSLYS